jgi:hypothetical protein
MFTVIPLALSMLLATAQEPIEEQPVSAEEQAEDMTPPQEQTEEVVPPQSSALNEWLESRLGDRQSNVGSKQSAKFGLQADMFLAITEKADAFEQFNRLRMRSLVFNAQQDLDFGVLFGTFAIGDYDDFDEVVVAQLGIMLTDIGFALPGTTDLQIGRYFADVGAFNSYLPADFAAPHLDGVRRSFFGGNLSLLGLELQNNTSLDNGHFHVSVGVASDRQSFDFDNFSPDSVTGSNANQRFSAENWLATSRASMQFDFNDSYSMRIGATAILSPAEVVFNDSGLPELEREEIEHNNFGGELGFVFNTGIDRSHELAFEVWTDDSQYLDDSSGAYLYSLSRGEWGMYQFNYDATWSLGALASRYDALGISDFDDDDAHHHSIWLSYSPTLGGDVSLFGTHTNPGQGQEKYFTVGMAFNLDFGRSQTRVYSRWY